MEEMTFVLDLNPKHNPYYKFGLICNPFHGSTSTGNQTQLALLKGLASGVPKDSLDKFLGQLGLSMEAVNIIKKETKENEKYQIKITWNEKLGGNLTIQKLES